MEEKRKKGNPMARKPARLPVKKTMDTCPQCGYDRGFHVSFRTTAKTVGIILICPNCGARYTTGWTRA